MKHKSTHARAVYVVDGVRTPFLKSNGKPGPFSASDLAVAAGRPLLARQHQLSPGDIDEVILGCVAPGPDEANIGRILALRLGCGERTPGWTVQRNCASGLQAVDNAAGDIATGRAELVLAGGTEAMSRHPLLLNPAMVAWLADWNRAKTVTARSRRLLRLRPRHFSFIVALLRGLTDPFTGLSMGQTAENLAYRFGIGREQMDRFALRSHGRLQAAVDGGVFEREIEPMFDVQGNLYEMDQGLRRDSDMDKLAALRPVFDRPHGLVTAGNSAQVSDGAAVLLLASEKAVEKHDLQVMGRIVDLEWAGLDPSQMGLGPVHAMAPLLHRHGLDSGDIDAWEINEAFAAQILACLEAWRDNGYMQREVGNNHRFSAIPTGALNRDGGAVSIGHPVGASGARLVLHLLNRLEREKGDKGIASLCIGGGQGGAIMVERMS